MSKRNIKAKSGKQLYLNSSFSKGMLYTSSEIPEGYTKLLNNFDISPSGDSITPRAPYDTILNNTLGLSKYTYPITFKQFPDKQFYINFPNTVSEKDYCTDNFLSDYDSMTNNLPINLFSRDINLLNNLSLGFDEAQQPEYSDENYVYTTIDSSGVISIKDYISNNTLYKNYDDVSISPVDELTYSSSFTFSVIDADTVYINGIKYRLININAPESGYKWYEYGKQVVNDILDQAIGVSIHTYGKDVYGRTIADVCVRLSTNLKSMYSLSQIILRLGLAKLYYIDESYPYIDRMKELQDLAKSDNLRVWDLNAPDIMYKGHTIDIIFRAEDNNGNNNITTGTQTKYVLEVVKIVEEKQTNYNTIHCIDSVEFAYDSYHDAYVFIGRVLHKSNSNWSIYYKGVMYFKYNSNTMQFEIELPPNNLNGQLVNIMEISSNGYNLLNKQTINTGDYSDTSLPLSFDGIVITPYNTENVLVSKAKVGDTITLRAIMNKSWYTIPEINFSSVEKVYIEYNIDYECKLSDSVNTRTVRGTINYNTNSTFILKNINLNTDGSETLTSLVMSITGYTIHYTYKDKEYSKEFNIDQGSLDYELVGNNPSHYYHNDNIIDSTCGLEMSYTNDTNVVEISISRINAVKCVDTTTSINIQGRWKIAPYNSNTYTTITPFENICEILEDYAVPTEWGTANTYNYTVTSDMKLTITFEYREYAKLVMGDIVLEEYTNAVYEDTYNTITYPSLQIDSVASYISHSDITENIDLTLATRVGVFDKQVYIYGPHMKSNTLFFSKFEQQWYFAFPYNAIDTEDKIVHTVNWNNNLIIFQQNSIWLLSYENSLSEESTLTKIYDGLSLTDIDKRLVKIVGKNLVFFNNNNGYIVTSSKYYNDPTYITLYKFTDNIANCLVDPLYLFRIIKNVPVNKSINYVRCENYLNTDNDHINIVSFIRNTDYEGTIIYRYNMLYKHWSTYSIGKQLSYAYYTEPNFGTQFLTYDKDTNQFGITYQNHNNISRENIECTLDTGFVSIDPLNDKRFKDIILNLDNIVSCQLSTGLDKNIIDIYQNFFIDGIPQVLSDDNTAMNFQYDNSKYPNSKPIYDEGDYTSKYIDYIDVTNNKDIPFGYNINTWSDIEVKEDTETSIINDNYDLKVQGRSQIRLPIYGKGRLPSMALKIKSKYPYEILSYSVIYKEKNINRRRL